MKITTFLFLASLSLTKCYYQRREETEEERVEKIEAQFELSIYDLLDAFDEVSVATRDFLVNKTSYHGLIGAEMKYLRSMKNQSIEMKTFDEIDVPTKFFMDYEIVEKLNYFALDEDDYRMFIEFSNHQRNKSNYNEVKDPLDETKLLNKQEYLNILATSRNETYLKELHSKWIESLSLDERIDEFKQILSLNEKAATLNHDNDPKSFWEDMSQYPDGYELAERLWDEFEPFYRKFHKFVLDRINRRYQADYTSIPAHLTGSRFGEDWSNVADVVLPHQQVYRDAVAALSEKKKEQLYKHCNRVAEELKLKLIPEEFWHNSVFDSELCEPEIVSFTDEKYSTIVITCPKVTWSEYLTTQETSIEVGLRNLDFISLPFKSLRYSFAEEALKSLGSTIAIRNLHQDHLIEKDAFTDHPNATENVLSSKFLLALRLFPRLAYYISADTFRLRHFENPDEDLIAGWHETRLKYQGVDGGRKAADFLEDYFITTNKPYLAKFLGIFLQFKFFDTFDYTTNFLDHLKLQDIPSMIEDIPTRKPMDLISYHFNTDEISSEWLLSYFSELEEYFETAPLEPLPYETKTLQKKKASEPKTTTQLPLETTEIQNLLLHSKENKIEESKIDEGERKDVKVGEVAGYSVGVYILITIGCCFFILVGVVVFKKVIKIKRPRTNNRRFQA